MGAGLRGIGFCSCWCHLRSVLVARVDGPLGCLESLGALASDAWGILLGTCVDVLELPRGFQPFQRASLGCPESFFMSKDMFESKSIFV